MQKYDSAVIGHVSKDINTDHLGNTVKNIGGAVVYSSASAYALGHHTAVITKLADEDAWAAESFTLPREDIFFLPTEKSTSISNVYHSADKERRTCRCISQGSIFTYAQLPDIDAQIYHIAGLIYGDYEDGFINALSAKGMIAVDVQGYLRHADKTTGEMYFEDWAEKKELLPLIDFLKTDAAEAEILTGLSDRYEAAKLLYSWGAKEILITHNTEVIAYDGSNFAVCPIKARNLSGRTGRGDTTFAAYINERLCSSMQEALLTATAAVSLKMETPGPLKGTRKDIEEYISAFYR